MGIIDFLNKKLKNKKNQLSNKDHSTALFENKNLTQTILQNLHRLQDQKTLDLLKPKIYMIYFNIEDSMDNILAKMEENQHSRYPVFNQTEDKILGILYTKDVFHWLIQNPLTKEEMTHTYLTPSMMKEPYFIPETKKLETLFGEFLKNKIHIAIALDLYGRISGLITLEDILELFIGNIDDEFDDPGNTISKITENVFEVDATTPLYQIKEELNISINAPESIHTLSGLIYNELDRKVQVGDKITKDDILYEVLSVENQTPKMIKLHIKSIKKDEQNLQ